MSHNVGKVSYDTWPSQGSDQSEILSLHVSFSASQSSSSKRKEFALKGR